MELQLRNIGTCLHEVARDPAATMRVPARVFADDELLAQIRRDHSLQQLVNVTSLPGIEGAALGMPDMHEGYGFPVGGVARSRRARSQRSASWRSALRDCASRRSSGASSATVPSSAHDQRRLPREQPPWNAQLAVEAKGSVPQC